MFFWSDVQFDGKAENWADFRIGFKVILRACDPAIEMVRLRNALPDMAAKFILDVSDPAKA